MKTIFVCLNLVLVSVVSSGCALSAGDAESDAAVASTEEALSGTNEECEAPNPDGPPISQTFFQTFWAQPGFISPSTYGSAACTNAYVVHLEDADGPTHVGLTSYWDAVQPASMPTTQSTCLRTRVGVYAWNIDQAVPVASSSEWRWGTWNGSGCSLSVKPTIVKDHRYRIAASVRLHDTAGDASSPFVLKAIAFRQNAFQQVN